MAVACRGARPSVLGWALARTAVGTPATFTSTDVYSIAATVNSDKKLGLLDDVEFMPRFIALARSPDLKPPMSPFQTGVIDTVAKKFQVAHGGVNSDAPAEGGGAVVSSDGGDQQAITDDPAHQILEVFKTAVREFNDSQRANYNARPVRAAVDRLVVDTTLLKAFDVHRVVQLLNYTATLHVKDYNLAVRLARRASELAPGMDVTQACTCFARLNALGVSDSFVALLNRVADHNATKTLSLGDCWLLVRGLELSPGINSHATALMSVVLYTLEEHIGALQLWQVVSVVEVCAKYDQRNAAATVSFLRRLAKEAGELTEHHLLVVLHAAKELRLLQADGGDVCRAFFDRAEALAASLDTKHIEPFLQLASVAPIATDAFMERLLVRIHRDAEKLQSAHLVSIIDVLASYPPARDSGAARALGTAAAMRSESFDREALTTAILGLAEMGFYGDDLSLLCERMAADKNGFKHPGDLVEFVDFLTPDAVRTTRAVDAISALAHHVAGAFSQQESEAFKAGLARIQIDERQIFGRGKGRADQVRRGLEEASRDRRAAEARMYEEEGFRADGSRVAPHQNQNHGGQRGGRGGYRGGRGGQQQQQGLVNDGKGGKKRNEPFNFKKAMWDMD